ncbi:MAG: hypothetical protein CM1200mP34_3780 [Verrucomicrobiales bacterium]|nr:MAG: hypothetical protein CM1200mP34_3780 [Verrucomicrobiales bacterium]
MINAGNKEGLEILQLAQKEVPPQRGCCSLAALMTMPSRQLLRIGSFTVYHKTLATQD